MLAKSGFPGVIVTVNCFQLLPSLLAQRYPSQFLNRAPLVSTTIRLALAIESIGIVETTYLIVGLLESLFFRRSGEGGLASSENIDGNFKESDTNRNAFDERDDVASESMKGLFLKGVKKAVSLGLFLSSAGFLLYNMIVGNSSFSDDVPSYGLVVITLLIYLLVFYCEGLKIAIVSTCNLSMEEQQTLGYSTNIKTSLSNGDDGVGRFLLGRQMIVVPLGFLISNITRFQSPMYAEMPVLFNFLLLKLNLPSMLVMMQLAQLSPQVLANSHIKSFLSLVGANLIVIISLYIEVLGLTQASYVFRALIERTCFCGNAGDGGNNNSNSNNNNGSSSNNQFDPIPNNENYEAILDSKRVAIAI